MSDDIVMKALRRMVSDHVRALAAIGEAIEAGTEHEDVDERIFHRSGDSEHRNLHLMIGGPSVYAQHQTFGGRWVLMGAWRDELHLHRLEPDKHELHRLAIAALETAS